MKKNVVFLSLFLFLVLSISQIKAQISATSTGGGSGTYTTLKGAFDKINDGTLTGDVTLQVTASTSETATALLSASGTGFASYTSVVVYPTSADLSIVADGTLPASSHLITLDGADNVTIDGRVNQSGARDDAHSLTIASTSLTASTIVLQADASSNIIKNCILKGNATSSKGIVWFSTATSTGNNSNLVDNNLITFNTTRPIYSIFSTGTSGAPNSNNTISNNDFKDCFSLDKTSNIIYITGDATNVISTGWTISGNSFFESGSFQTTNTANTTLSCICFGTSGTSETGNNNLISENYIGGTATHCGGGTFTKSYSSSFRTDFSGFWINSKATSFSIQNNTFQKISWTNGIGGSPWYAMNLNGTGSFNIGTDTGNTIGNNTTTGSIAFSTVGATSSLYGMSISNTGTTVCKNNKIGSITATNSVSTNTAPIICIVKQSSAGTAEISNNAIGSLTTANSVYSAQASTSASEMTGIKSYSTVTGNKIENNTIANLVTGGNTGLLYGIFIGNSLSASPNNTTALSTAPIGTTTVNANLIHSLSAPNSSAAQVMGIYLNTSNATVTNNVVALNATNSVQLLGISEAANSYITKIYHNTVYLSGTLPSGSAQRSAGIYAQANTAVSNRDIRNNILFNNRTNTGTPVATGVHSAINFSSALAGGGSVLVCDYNDLFTANTASVGVYNNGAKTFSVWKTTGIPANGGTYSPDPTSISVDPMFYNAGGFTAVSYSVSPSRPGTPIGTVTTDYSSITRSGSTPSIGAFENYSVITKLIDMNENNTRIIRNSDGIVVNLDGVAAIELYSISGKLIEKKNAVGSYSRKLESGAYVIRVNGKSSKFIK